MKIATNATKAKKASKAERTNLSPFLALLASLASLAVSPSWAEETTSLPPPALQPTITMNKRSYFSSFFTLLTFFTFFTGLALAAEIGGIICSI